jgi:hypothetical protein
MLRIEIASGLIVTLMLLAPASTIAQERSAASYPDIGVMSSVLRQLLRGTTGEEHSGVEVSGSYLPDYGLLFVVDYSGGDFGPELLAGKLAQGGPVIDMRAFDSSMAAFDSAMANLDIRLRHYDAMMAHKDSAIDRVDRKMGHYDSIIARNDSIISRHGPIVRVHPPRVDVRTLVENERWQFTKEKLAKIDGQIVKFLGSYADAENKLAANQRVSVVVLLGGGSQPRYYTVSRKQISDYRSQAESETSFRQNVQISELRERHDSVGIMETILDKSIADRLAGVDRLIFGPNSAGIYLKGLGAFFVCKLSGLSDFEITKKGTGSATMGTAELENLIVRTIGNYGSTLKFMPADESIMVSLRFNLFGSGDEDVLMSVKKKDADAYSRNEISYDTFRQRTTVITSR